MLRDKFELIIPLDDAGAMGMPVGKLGGPSKYPLDRGNSVLFECDTGDMGVR